MTSEDRERPETDLEQAKPGRGRRLADDDSARDEGGDSACWAHLICPECGAIETDGHRPGCPAGRTG
jgi:hypothetical protein